jgi:hypothetical protein
MRSRVLVNAVYLARTAYLVPCTLYQSLILRTARTAYLVPCTLYRLLILQSTDG